MVSTFTVYAGSYAAAGQPGVRALAFDGQTGALAEQSAFSEIVNPSFLVLHPNRRWLYAVSETSAKDGAPGGVWALEAAGAPPAFRALNHRESGGDWPCHLALDPSGRRLAAANYGSGTVSLFPIQADGSLGERTALVQHAGRGPNAARQEGPHAHSTVFTPDGRTLIAADLGLDALLIYRVDERGALGEYGRLAARPGAGPRHTVFHPNGRILYAANELDSTVAVCAYDARNGTLREQQHLSTLPEDFAGENTVADIHLSADAHRLYVSNRGHNSLAVYAVDQAGGLSRLAIADCGGNWPRNFALSPDGGWALAANQYSGEIASLRLKPGAGEVGLAGARLALPQVSCLVFAA